MNALKWKIFLSNNLPTGLFLLLSRIYRLGAVVWSKLPGINASQKGLAIRVAQRSLSEADHELLTHQSDPRLRHWNEAFAAYEDRDAKRVLDLAWVHKPVGGNFGDWLSPYLVHGASGTALNHVDLGAARKRQHILSLGSIISQANANSVVLGSGINSIKDAINPAARYLMVRGHITREALPANARSQDIPCCDPGFFIRELYQPHPVENNRSSRLLIPHVNHQRLFSTIHNPNFELLSANVSRPLDIEALIDRIAAADEVVTSAMHIFVTCCAYGVRCGLIKPVVADVIVPGDGIKYRDCMTPVISSDFAPQSVEIREGFRIEDEVGTKVFNIDFAHIQKSFSLYRSFLKGI
ncbi:hypothetical protein J3454_15665 [Erythrobacter sp. NFXS35]|uniref:hypothetical protein n=1 Tax=Erythrobacter sp. NFXS35 TaxID=2818436 RepID=UPI0032DFC0F3